MKILFVYPNVHNAARINMGIAYLSACLKNEGHQVELFDTTFYKSDGQLTDDELREKTLQLKGVDLVKHGVKYRSSSLLFDDFRSQVINYKPDILALSCVDATYFLGKKLIKSVQDIKPFTIVGGTRAIVDPTSLMKEDWVDAVCVGEGEEAMTQFCDRMSNGGDISNIENIWVNHNGNLIKNPIRQLSDLNDLPIPDWDIFDNMHFIRPFAGKVYKLGSFDMSRGCPYRCSYCVNVFQGNLYKGKGRYFRQKSPDKMITELKFKKEKYDLKLISFYDDLFPTADYIDKFCELYKKEIALPFFINMRPESVKKELIQKLADAGLCSVSMGLESGDYEYRKKYLARKYTNQQVLDAFKIVNEYNIRTTSFNIIGLPFETREQIFKTIELNKIVKPSSATVSYFYPYRGTELRELCIKEKFFDPQGEDNMDIAHRSCSSLTMPQISVKELENLFSRFQLYLKLPKIFWPLIKITEKASSTKGLLYKFLVFIFNFYTKEDFEWDFSKKDSSSKT